MQVSLLHAGYELHLRPLFAYFTHVLVIHDLEFRDTKQTSAYGWHPDLSFA